MCSLGQTLQKLQISIHKVIAKFKLNILNCFPDEIKRLTSQLLKMIRALSL